MDQHYLTPLFSPQSIVVFAGDSDQPDSQTALARADWPAWCARLEQTLARIAGSPVVDYFRALGLNPLSPLRGAAFRPDFAEADTTREGEMYAAALARVEDKWGVGALQAIGAGVR